MSILSLNVPLISLIFLKRPLVFPCLLISSISLHFLPWKADFSKFPDYSPHNHKFYIGSFLCLIFLFSPKKKLFFLFLKLITSIVQIFINKVTINFYLLMFLGGVEIENTFSWINFKTEGIFETVSP